MSKQINYYMDKKTECDFIRFAYDNSFVFIRWDDGTMVNPLEDNSLFYFITKEIYFPFLKFRNDAVDVLNCLVIEYTRNNIIENKKTVTRGRLYISDAYKESEYYEYMNDFNNDYNQLRKWIKANVPNQYFINGGIKQKEYISDSMLVYSKREYKFRS